MGTDPTDGAVSTGPASPPPTLDRRTWLTVAAMSLASGMVWLAVSDLSILLPTIQRELDASFSELQWINGVSFTIALAALVVIGGRLADAYGRRRVLGWGLTIFAAASAAAGLAPGTLTLIISRGLQGVGGALVLPASLAVIVAAVPSGARGLPIGVWGAVTGLLQGAAPLLAGAFESLDVWRAVFWINLPLALLVFAVSRSTVDESREPATHTGLDPTGAVLLSSWVTALALVLIQGDEWGWVSLPSIGLVATTIVAAAAFCAVELRSAAPLVRLALFRNPLYAGSNLLVLTANLVFAGLMFFLALYLQNVLDESALIAGLAFLPGAIVIAGLAPVAGRLFDRAHPRWSGMPGALLFAAACAAALGVGVESGYALILAVFLLAGAGVGFVVTFTAAGAVHAAPAGEAGAAGGVVSISSTIGAALGTALTGALFEAVAEPQLVDTAAAEGVAVPDSLSEDLVGILSGSDSATAELATYSSSQRQVIEDAAQLAFVDGLRLAMVVLVVLMLAVSVVTWFSASRDHFDPSNRPTGAGR